MDLVIVESPTKAKTLSKYLGKDFVIEASMGHVRDLPKSKLGVDVDKDFEPEYVLALDKGKIVKKLTSEAKKAKIVYLAMDPDREGEAIAYHVRHVIATSNKQQDTSHKFKRVTFHEITKDAILKSMEKPGTVNMELVDAQQARRVVDRLAGYSLSPVLWKKVRRGLSAGRVQSVALRLIVEREAEIEAFKPQEYWNIAALLRTKKKQAGEFLADLWSIDGIKAKKGEFLVTGKERAEQVVVDLRKSSYKINGVERKERKSSPYPPFTTSTLQQAGATVFGWTARQTMRVAQQLYEKGEITYHRTDSVNLAKSAVNAARKWVESKYGKEYVPEEARFYKSRSKNVQEAHEAIRPTEIGRDALESKGKLNSQHAKLYRLIWQRMVASQMSDALYDATTIDVLAVGSKSRYGLRVAGSVRKFEGWRKLYSREGDDVILPEAKEGDDLTLKKLLKEQKFTQPPPRFNDASLVKGLEELGIGRPSTYAPIISTLIFRGYIERKERRFYPSSVGITVVKFLLKNFKGIMDYNFTAEMEEDLDRIARGEKKWVPVVKEFWEPFIKKIKDVEEKAKRVAIPVEKTGKKCPTCSNGDEVIRSGRFGKFLSCSSFPECKYTASFVEKVEGMKCEKCKEGDVVVKKTRTRRSFYGCSRYPKCDWASWKKPGGKK